MDRSQKGDAGARETLSDRMAVRVARTGPISKRRWLARRASEGTPRFALMVLFNIATILHIGWDDPIFHSQLSHWTQFLILAVYIAFLLWAERGELFKPGFRGLLRASVKPQRLIALIAVALCWWWPALAIAGALLMMLHFWSAYVWLLQRNMNPSVVFVGSFLALIFVGTVALKLPASTPPDHPISWVDAAFTSTSAACVTGLIVRDTPHEFTRFGHFVLMALFQLGGLGVILFGSMVALLLGSSISLKAVHAMTDNTQHGAASASSVRRLVIFAALVVFGLEAIGAAGLYFGWPDSVGWPGAPAGIDQPADRAFHAVFFSVSAFCNAGFATTSDSLEAVRLHWTTHLIIGGLIVIGALGLPVYANLAQIFRARIKGRLKRSTGALVRMTLHTRIVIVVSLVVHTIATLGIFLGDFFQRDEAWFVALLDGNFMSITGTAGFTTTPPATMGPFARLSLMFAMFVGGSPGSVAGGIKTIVFGILAVAVWATISGREGVHIFKRRIPDVIVRKAITLFVLHVLLVTTVTGTLLFTEGDNLNTPKGIGIFEACLFESISGCSTVGLSLGITPDLSTGGRIAVTIGMFVGRVGSLAFLVSLIGFAAKRRPRYTYPTEAVVLS